METVDKYRDAKCPSCGAGTTWHEVSASWMIQCGCMKYEHVRAITEDRLSIPNEVVIAARFAELRHRGQVRKYSNAPYITHPLRVMSRAMLLSDAPAVWCAAVLHDVVEDCGVSVADIQLRFGSEVSRIVAELTNRSKLDHPELNREDRKRVDRERLSQCSHNAKFIKLIDRIDNLRDIPPGEPFLEVYKAESQLLLEVLRGTHVELEAELAALVYALGDVK